MIKALHTGPFQVNTYIVGLEGSSCLQKNENVLIVDPACCDFCGDTFVVGRELEKLSLKPVAFVLTHGHFDHVAGLKVLKATWPDVPILINSLDRNFIGSNSRELQSRSLYMMGFEDFIPSVSDLPEPDGFLEDGSTLDVCVEKALLCMGNNCVSGKLKQQLSQWNVIATPGHSKGSVCIYSEKQRCLLSGDTVFYHSWGRTDLPGGDENTIQRSLKKIYHNIPGTTLVFPGHDQYGFLLGENI